MRVLYDNREYLIEFAYGVLGHGDPRAIGRELTRCLIRDGGAPRVDHELAPVLATGEVVRYYLDTPNRDKARKWALKKALEQLDRVLPSLADTAREGRLRDKERREKFWKAYLERKVQKAEGAA
jgi:hypothetical protein